MRPVHSIELVRPLTYSMYMQGDSTVKKMLPELMM